MVEKTPPEVSKEIIINLENEAGEIIHEATSLTPNPGLSDNFQEGSREFSDSAIGNEDFIEPGMDLDFPSESLEAEQEDPNVGFESSSSDDINEFPSVHDELEKNSLDSPPTEQPPLDLFQSKNEPEQPAEKKLENRSEKNLDSLHPNRPIVSAAFPFSLRIRGKLKPWEKEKLVDLMVKERMGIDPRDLEDQFNQGQVLIPRISEFAAILLAHTIRDADVEIDCGPSSEIFSGSADDGHREIKSQGFTSVEKDSSKEDIHSIPIVKGERIPGMDRVKAIDTIVVITHLKTSSSDVTHSSEFQEHLAEIQETLRIRALRKGAAAVIRFQVEVTALPQPFHFKIIASGLAVKGV